MAGRTYASAGVDIDKGDRFVEFIKSMKSRAVSKSIGGFSGAFEIPTERYSHPLLLTTTDGVGTKLLVARKLGRYDTVGVDLVAMCVNDLAVCGAEPAVFLDYIACGGIDETLLQEIMKGIVTGCEIAECTLSGGETAELPDMYAAGDFDLAGFAVGVVERSKLLPKVDEITSGDLIMGLPSVGIHSNGLSLARKIVPESRTDLWEELLRPTKIYVSELRALMQSGALLAAAHITGGGLEANFDRVIPQGLKPVFTYDWELPGIFQELHTLGDLDMTEMRRVFNMGIGVAFVVKPGDKGVVEASARDNGIAVMKIGELILG